MSTTMAHAAVASTGEGLESAACPRCGSSEGSVVVEGKDYLHNLEGAFFGWQCAGCGLQYQNPRPTADQLEQLYPSNYLPHTAAPSTKVQDHQTPQLQEAKSDSPAGTIRTLLGRVFERLLRSLHYRTGIGFFQPSPTEMIAFLAQQMGYAHFGDGNGATYISRAIIRDCRRLAGIQLIPNFVPGGRLLEIGCAKGDQLQAYRDQGWEHLEGIELTQQAATQAQQRGFSVVCDQVENALGRLPDESFDVIVSSMVLEHLYDPFTVVRTIARKLKPGGQFLFSTVTLDSLDARWFGKYWGGYDFPRHMVYLRMADIEGMIAPEFEQVERFHQNAPVDFLRPAIWRAPENRFSDRLVARLAKAKIGLTIGEMLARMGQTCRVSIRCHKK